MSECKDRVFTISDNINCATAEMDRWQQKCYSESNEWSGTDNRIDGVQATTHFTRLHPPLSLGNTPHFKQSNMGSISSLKLERSWCPLEQSRSILTHHRNVSIRIIRASLRLLEREGWVKNQHQNIIMWCRQKTNWSILYRQNLGQLNQPTTNKVNRW